MKKIFLTLLMIVVLGIVGFFAFSKFQQPEAVHYHAGFQVYIDGNLQDFSDPKYMEIKPCGDEKNHKEDEQIEKAHLHDQVGDVVHVHRPGVHWADLFKNINYTFPKDKQIASYINGKHAQDVLNQEIKPYESIVIGDQASTSAYLKNAVTKEHIVETEKRSENCGSHE